MIDPKRARLPIIRQCTLLHLNRSGVYYRPVPQSEANLALMRLIDAQFLETPYHGAPTSSGPGLTPDQRANSNAVRMAA